MKKFLFLGAMAALLLGTASCSNEMEPAMGGEVPVSFAIDLGDNIDSRTISDGTGANQLKFAVFENGTEISALAQTVAVVDKKATISTKLVKGHTYSFVFWAQNSACTAYNTSDMSAIKVDYAANCNDESRDAFYKMDSFTVTKPFEKDEVLTRPFAQINFLADDAAGVVGVDAYKSKVTVTGVPTTLNTLDGSVSGSADVTFDYATIINSQEKLEGYKDYRYVAMNYILAATDKEVKNEVVLTVNDGTQDVNTVTVANCPVQRNYRTNIFGSLFTLDGKFNIVIDPIYAGNHDVDLDATVFNVTSNEELDAALQSDAKKIVINLPEGEWKYKAQHRVHIQYGGENTQSITIIGAGIDKTLFKGATTYRSQIATRNPDCVVTLKNMTVTSVHVNAAGEEDLGFATTWDAYDYGFCCNINTDNVHFIKPIALMNAGKKSYFKNTTIEVHEVIGGGGSATNDAYAVWACAGTDATFENCHIEGTSTQTGHQNRCIKLSDQYDSDPVAMSYLNIINCSFKSDKKAAILVGNAGGANIDVNGIDITEVTADQTHAVWIDKGWANYANLVTVTGASCIVEP